MTVQQFPYNVQILRQLLSREYCEFLIDVNPLRMYIMLMHMRFIRQTKWIITLLGGEEISLNPEVEDECLFTFTIDVPSVVLTVTCFATSSCFGKTSAIFSDFEKTLAFILSDYDIIGTGICLSSFVSFLLLEYLVSLKCLYNIYMDQYLLSACDCVTALVLNS